MLEYSTVLSLQPKLLLTTSQKGGEISGSPDYRFTFFLLVAIFLAQSIHLSGLKNIETKKIKSCRLSLGRLLARAILASKFV
jgi:hypothetical protein